MERKQSYWMTEVKKILKETYGYEYTRRVTYTDKRKADYRVKVVGRFKADELTAVVKERLGITVKVEYKTAVSCGYGSYAYTAIYVPFYDEDEGV